MLQNSKDILTKAMEEKYAIAQFNINNLEWTKYILEESNKNKSPIILGVSESAINYMGGYNIVYNLVVSMIKDLNISIPVVLHLDHGSTIENCKKAIDAGFTSVMIDASKYDIEKNIEITKKVCEYAENYNVSVEAEIGSINEKECAQVEDCVKLYQNTGILSLAPALGSAHGLYKEVPQLNFKRIEEIKNELNIPLVLHGGTGIPDEDIVRSIECGITKININTELQTVWNDEIRKYLINNKEIYDPRKIIGSGEEKIKNVISNKLHLLGSCNKI